MAHIRSPRHPNHNLEDAIEFIAKVHAEDRQHPVSRDVAARHMGFSGITGTSDRALASLMHYGLAEKAVKGEIRVTDLALEILHPANERERMKALNLAGFNPELFRELRTRYPDAPPSAASLESFLSRSGFATVAIRPASKAYLETCQYLQRNGAYESDGAAIEEAPKSADTTDVGDRKQMEMAPIKPAQPERQAIPISTRSDVFVLSGGGEIIANLPDAMSARDYDDLKDWLELMIRKAGRKVVRDAPRAASAPEEEQDGG